MTAVTCAVVSSDECSAVGLTQPAGLLGALYLAGAVHATALVLTWVLLTALAHLQVDAVGGGRGGDQVPVGLGRTGKRATAFDLAPASIISITAQSLPPPPPSNSDALSPPSVVAHLEVSVLLAGLLLIAHSQRSLCHLLQCCSQRERGWREREEGAKGRE